MSIATWVNTVEIEISIIIARWLLLIMILMYYETPIHKITVFG